MHTIQTALIVAFIAILSCALALAHGIPYVATATVADLRDLEAKVERAMELRGARYLHVFVPCPLGWGAASHDTILDRAFIPDGDNLFGDRKLYPALRFGSLKLSRDPINAHH